MIGSVMGPNDTVPAAQNKHVLNIALGAHGSRPETYNRGEYTPHRRALGMASLMNPFHFRSHRSPLHGGVQRQESSLVSLRVSTKMNNIHSVATRLHTARQGADRFWPRVVDVQAGGAYCARLPQREVPTFCLPWLLESKLRAHSHR